MKKLKECIISQITPIFLAVFMFSVILLMFKSIVYTNEFKNKINSEITRINSKSRLSQEDIIWLQEFIKEQKETQIDIATVLKGYGK